MFFYSFLPPTLSSLSVNNCVASCLRYRCSMSYLSISPLHDIFRLPPQYSRMIVSTAVSELIPEISPLTYPPTYAPFRPSDSGYSLLPPYYRGCWHGVSRCLFIGYRQPNKNVGVSSPIKEVYNPEDLHPPRGMADSDLRPLTNIPYCCLP